MNQVDDVFCCYQKSRFSLSMLRFISLSLERILKAKKNCRLEIFRKDLLFFDRLLISLAPGHKQLAQGNSTTAMLFQCCILTVMQVKFTVVGCQQVIICGINVK